MARRGTFAFDLSKPLKRGTLLKQGAFHKAFKYRYFVLYPGFLVYYDDSQKWKLDVTKGNTLGGRLGAIKLKNGTCNLARDAPKGCKFGLIIHAPDPANKRPTYLINATSKDERDEWIDAIKRATPQRSPKGQKKEIVNVAKKGSDKEKEEKVPPHPTRAERQETANAAALIASEGSTVVNGGDRVEESITSIDEQLELPPSTIDVRRDTATAAALAVSEEKPSSLSDIPEQDQEQATSIDELLGPQNEPKEDSDGETGTPPLQNGTTSPEADTIPNGTCDPLTDVPPSSPENISPDPSTNVEPSPATPEQEAESKPMECNETVESTVNSKGKLEVVTTVTIACTSNGDTDLESTTAANERGGENTGSCDSKDACTIAAPQKDESLKETSKTEKNGDQEQKQQLESNKEEMKSSSEVLLSTNDSTPNSFSVNVAMQVEDSDNTTSDEDSETPRSSLSDVPITPQGVANGSVSSASPTTPSFPPAITIESPEGDKINKERAGSGSSDGSNGRLSPPQTRRKSSTPFIEKTGFLYKMGGKHKNWRRRFFILKPGAFNYYKKDPSSKPLGEVKLKNMSIFFPGVGERKQSFQFTVHTESSWNKRSDWVLAAQSEREMKEWITAFKLAGQKPGTPISSSPPSGSDTEQ